MAEIVTGLLISIIAIGGATFKDWKNKGDENYIKNNGLLFLLLIMGLLGAFLAFRSGKEAITEKNLADLSAKVYHDSVELLLIQNKTLASENLDSAKKIITETNSALDKTEKVLIKNKEIIKNQNAASFLLAEQIKHSSNILQLQNETLKKMDPRMVVPRFSVYTGTEYGMQTIDFQVTNNSMFPIKDLMVDITDFGINKLDRTDGTSFYTDVISADIGETRDFCHKIIDPISDTIVFRITTGGRFAGYESIIYLKKAQEVIQGHGVVNFFSEFKREEFQAWDLLKRH